MSSRNNNREETAGFECAVPVQAHFQMSHKSSLAAASVYLIGIRLGAMWIAEDGKYVLNLLLCPTTDPKAWERSCWSPLLHAGSFCYGLSCLGAGSPSHSPCRLSVHPLPHVPLCPPAPEAEPLPHHVVGAQRQPQSWGTRGTVGSSLGCPGCSA